VLDFVAEDVQGILRFLVELHREDFLPVVNLADE
jgi:hypothetical protein